MPTVRPARARDTILLWASVILVGLGLHLAKPVLAPVLFAAFVAAITSPLVLGLTRRGVPTIVAVLAGLLVDALAIGGIGVVVAGTIAELTERQAFYEERFTVHLEEVRRWLVVHGVEVSQDSLESIVEPQAMLGYLGQGVQRVAAMLSQFTLVLFIVAFMLVEATGLRRKVAAIQTHQQITALQQTARELRGFLAVKLGTSATTGMLAGTLCYSLDIDLPLLWALVAFLLNFIPTVGSIIAAVPPTLLALLLYGPAVALALAGGYVAINTVVGMLIEPRWMGKTLGLSPLVVFLGMLVWGYLLGIVGALLSPTLTMFLKSWLQHSEDLRWVATLMGPPPTEATAENESRLTTSDADSSAPAS